MKYLYFNYYLFNYYLYFILAHTYFDIKYKISYKISIF